MPDASASALPDPSAFGALPLEQQTAALERALPDHDARALLALCADLRDHAPLAWLCAQLAPRGFYGEATQRAWFARFLVALPETAVHRVVRALTAEPAGPSTAAVLVEALAAVSLARLPSLCVLDRALRQHYPDAWEQHVDAVVARCAEALRAGRAADVALEALAQVPARAVEPLRALAAARGADVAAAFDARRVQLAAEAVGVLGAAPKAVSQANAEELLSRRVYTDPGHFLIELLQNAEDAGARTWRVRFEARRIVVWHDGTPFDVRDLVGVTSIGQTTKRRQQIGFFGVGFKSVYEVTERPQIYSDVYRFEIADVSVPRALAARPADVPADGTVLVLPLRDPGDPARSPRALFDKARALDPCVLLTLRSIAAIELDLARDAGGPARHAIAATPGTAGRWTLREEHAGRASAFLVHDEEHRYDAARREPGRTDRTRVMVGVRLGDDGAPRPLEPGAPSVYSYLPTAERSGLRFFVQGHFDVPVDRERVAPDSAWNRWILSRVPGLLRHVATLLSAEAAALPPDAHRRAGLLDVLPLAHELPAPLFRVIPEGLRDALADAAVVPCTDGRLHPAAHVLLAPAPLAALFGGAPLAARLLATDGTAATRELYFADPALSPRARDVATSLGAAAFDVPELLGVLERALAAVPDGRRPAAADAPAFLRDGPPAALAALYAVLHEHAEALTRDGATEAEQRLFWRLRALPLVPDAAGGLHRTRPSLATGPSRAAPALRAVYGALRPFVHPEFDPQPALETSRDDDDGNDSVAAGATGAFLDRLGVRRLEVAHLVDDLEHARLPADDARLAAVLALLVGAPWELQKRAGALPLFRATDGARYPAARDLDDRAGVLAVGRDPVGARLRGFYAARRPIAHPESDGPNAEAALLERLGAPTLGLEALVRDLSRGLFSDLPALHALLESLRDELPARTRASLAALPIWPDRRGTGRPLAGENAVAIPAHDALGAFFPDDALLHPDVAARAHVATMGVAPIGLDAVVFALAPDAPERLRLAPTAGNVARVLALVRAHGDVLSVAARERLTTLPALLDDAGAVCTLADLSLPASPALRALYRGHPRRFVDPAGETVAVLRKLQLAGRLRAADTAALVEDLAALAPALQGRRVATALPLVGDGAGLTALLAYLAEQVSQMPRALVERALELPIYPDHRGYLCALGDLRRDVDPLRCYACDPAVAPVLTAASIRLLDADALPHVAPLLSAVGARVAQLELVLVVAKRLPHLAPGQAPTVLQSPSNLAQLHALLVARRAELLERHPPTTRPNAPPANPLLAALNIWRTIAGAVVSADHVVDPTALLPLMDPGTPERARLDAARLDAPAWAAFSALGPLVAPAPAHALVRELVRHHARPGAPLASQPRFLGTVARVADVARLVLGDAPAVSADTPVPQVDAAGRLRFEPLRDADAATRALVAGTELARELLHPDLAAVARDPRGPERVPLAPFEVIETLRTLATSPEHPTSSPEHAARRARFYAWLAAHEREVFSDARCRQLLADAPLFPTARGRLAAPRDLVLDPELPDLGIDWRPSPEIPADVLSLLARHLDVGTPPLDDLLARHLLPAYTTATERADGQAAAAILRYLARKLSGRPVDSLLRLLRASDPEGTLRLEDTAGRFRRPDQLLLPDPDLAPHVAALWGTSYPAPARRYGDELHPFLLALGVRRLPDLARVSEAVARPPAHRDRLLALAAVCGRLYREHGARLLEALPLRTAAWIVDGTGCARPAEQLYRRDPDVEALVGAFPELYPHAGVQPLLGDALTDALGFRTARDARLPEVLRHIEARAAAHSPLPFRVYQWLERALAEGRVDPAVLTGQLSHRAWIDTDDGRYFNHRQVLGVWAIHYFRDRRGYWVRGRAECPRLCALFEINAAVTPRDVSAFLADLGAEIARDGDRAVLAREPALPHMLFACYALLGRGDHAVDRALPVVLCAAPAASDDEPASARFRLLPATAHALLRSDTPTLDALFAGAGTFYLAARGPADDRAFVDRFHHAMGVRRLREAYTVAVDSTAGRDTTATRTHEIQRLRGVLRALLGVLPRIRQKRLTHAPGWVADARLRPLSTAGAVRAVDPLRVRYVLEGIGEARAEVPAVYDRAAGALLVDASVLDAADGPQTGLAQALLPTIYDGPGDDQLVDLLEILLPLATRERMNAYLDRRHFPAIDAPARPHDQLAERLGEILDYGLDQRLAQRFPALQGRDFARWRRPDVLDAALPRESDPPGEADRAVLARRAAPGLLAALDLAAATELPAALTDALVALLAAPSLAEVPPALLTDASAPPAIAYAPLPTAPEHLTHNDDPPDLAALAALTSLARSPAVAPAPPAHDDAPSALPTPQEGQGMWRQMLRWLGLAESAPAASPAWTPPWTQHGANTLAPGDAIPPQFWATVENRRRIARNPAGSWLAHSPARLPAPHLYAVHTLGASFDPRTQAWTPHGAPPPAFYAPPAPSGRTLLLQGRLLPGTSQLPVPLHARLSSPVRALDAPAEVLGRHDTDPARVFVRGAQPVTVQYAVELADVPALTQGTALVAPPAALLAPTLALRELPAEAARWVAQQRAAGRPHWAIATAAQEFVQKHYAYDEQFLTHPAVQRARDALAPGRGNHHLSLLHATRDGARLGRGICYELNILVVELLRHAGVPAMVATGWVFDDGRVDRPDHLFALAVVPSGAGPCLLPLDAAVGPQGPLRPLAHDAPRADALDVASLAALPAMPAVPPVPGPWTRDPLTQRAADGAAERWETDARAAEDQRLALEAALLARAIALVCAATGRPPPGALDHARDAPTPARVAALRTAATELLHDTELLGALLALLRGDYRQLTALPPRVQDLVRLGVAQVRTIPAFSVEPVAPPDAPT